MSRYIDSETDKPSIEISTAKIIAQLQEIVKGLGGNVVALTVFESVLDDCILSNQDILNTSAHLRNQIFSGSDPKRKLHTILKIPESDDHPTNPIVWVSIFNGFIAEEDPNHPQRQSLSFEVQVEEDPRQEKVTTIYKIIADPPGGQTLLGVYNNVFPDSPIP